MSKQERAEKDVQPKFGRIKRISEGSKEKERDYRSTYQHKARITLIYRDFNFYLSSHARTLPKQAQNLRKAEGLPLLSEKQALLLRV